jgi:acetate kinase
LHNPPNLTGIEVCRERWPLVPQIAVFDTAFHQSMPPEAYRYALPESLYRDSRIRRYGFHGTSFAYVTKRAGAYLGRDPDSLNLIALHLGNGASAAAIRNGRSVDTSMGMTPLAGLMMGTRCGDIDPGVLIHLLEQQDRAVPELGQLLNKESGLKGIAGSNDMRDVLAGAEAGNAASRLAIDMYAYRIRKYVGAYWAILGRVDALVFTGGIGEHAPVIRREACRDLENLGIELDQEANLRTSSGIAEIQSAGSRVRILIVPTDEELEIARQSVELLGFSRAS